MSSFTLGRGAKVRILQDFAGSYGYTYKAGEEVEVDSYHSRIEGEDDYYIIRENGSASAWVTRTDLHHYGTLLA
jgi:hypothetical protein